MFRSLLLAVCLSLGLTAVTAQELDRAAPSPIEMTLVPQKEGLTPGQTAQVLVHVHVPEGWHIYWKNPGDSGFPTEIQWTLPQGVVRERETWAPPERFEENGQVCFGYSQDFVILEEFLVPKDVQVAELELGATLTWLACRDACIPGAQSKELRLPVHLKEGSVTNQWSRLMSRYGALVTHPLAKAMLDKQALVLDLGVARGVTAAYFFPEQDGLIDYTLDHELIVTATGQQLSIPLKSPEVKGVRGVVVARSSAGDLLQTYQVDATIPVAGTNVLVKGVTLSKLCIALLCAFAGGLILNLMPCVLPVVSLKIFQFINLAGSKPGHALRHGLVFTAGVVVSFWALAGALLGLRSYGQSVGWGFQLQEPAFVVVLALLMFLLGLSLLGVFELGTSLVALGGKTQRKSGFASSFFSGVLATAVATPCTGPLLAPAVGFAVTLPVILSMIVFTVLALGMATPYLVLSAFPQALRWLPKPGIWMVVFKQIMGFFMLATTLWLLWVFSAQVDSGYALIWLLSAMLIVAIAAWIYGRFGTVVQKKSTRWIARAVALSLLVAGGFLGVDQARSSASAELSHAADWLSWDRAQLDQLRSEGKMVFVDFTAKWCLICQTNKVPMHSHEVAAAFERYGVVKMEADWTRRDPTITAELEKFGRSGVPLYVLYLPNGEHKILPQLLTPESLIKAVNQSMEKGQS